MFLGFIKNVPLINSLFPGETKEAQNIKNDQSEQSTTDFKVIVPTSFKPSEVLALENKLAEIYDEKSFLVKSDPKAKKIKLILKPVKSKEGKPSLVLEFNNATELLKELRANKGNSFQEQILEKQRNQIKDLSSIENKAASHQKLEALGIHICPPGCEHEEVISKNESEKGTDLLYESLSSFETSPPIVRKTNQSISPNTILNQALQKLKEAQTFEEMEQSIDKLFNNSELELEEQKKIIEEVLKDDKSKNLFEKFFQETLNLSLKQQSENQEKNPILAKIINSILNNKSQNPSQVISQELLPFIWKKAKDMILNKFNTENSVSNKIDELLNYLESVGKENEAMHEKLSEGSGFKTLSLVDSNLGYEKPENICLDIVTKENNVFKVERYKLLDYLKNSETLPFAISELKPHEVHGFMHDNKRGFETSKIFLTDLKNKISPKPANEIKFNKPNKTKNERPIGFKILKETLLQQLAKIKDLFTKLNNDSEAKKSPFQANNPFGKVGSLSSRLLSSTPLDKSLQDSNWITKLNIEKSLKLFLQTFSEPNDRKYTLIDNQILINELEAKDKTIFKKIKAEIPQYFSDRLHEIFHTTSQLKQNNLKEFDKASLRKEYAKKRIDLAQRSNTLLSNFNFETEKLPPNIKSSLEQSSKEALDFARDLASKPEFKNTYESNNGQKKAIEINQVGGYSPNGEFKSYALTGEKTILPDDYLNNVEAQSEFRNSKEKQYKEILDAIPEEYDRENLFKDEVAREINSPTAIETPSTENNTQIDDSSSEKPGIEDDPTPEPPNSERTEEREEEKQD
ncbi:MAG: hypothetical protein HRT47_13365 [Candidatus Caenarcaniphilales bacterium]|nr:hypothetical protein [Candidatus Caenarcaniphilales bacterium]